jgi:aspartyl-tRNA(Asn)/glutamyl-tRNA(Gln) amidotransferase subunit B
MSNQTNYETIIGLEVHAQLNTEAKIFCQCSTKFGAEQNSQTCPVCLGLPGVLPVLNEKVVEFAVKIAVALNCNIADFSVFARKNYFYPDLPKGYQISQYEQPLATKGYIEIEVDDKIKQISINRIHLEEDAGKSIHHEQWIKTGKTFLDLNRCGVPLVEIVSEPDISTPKEASLYLRQLRQILMFLDVCDGNMEESSLRCDANISVRQQGQKELGVKSELKNMNTFKGVEKALEFEKNRQIKILENGGEVLPDTLLWDKTENITVPIRTKESEQNYRYFPEPDLPPLYIDKSMTEKIKKAIPELPLQKRNRFVSLYKIPKYDADVLTETKCLADYFEMVACRVKNKERASNWVMGELVHASKTKKHKGKCPISAESLAELIECIDNGLISNNQAKTVFSEMLESGKSVSTIIRDKRFVHAFNNSDLKLIVEEMLAKNSNEVKKYKEGKRQVLDFFVGHVMKTTKGKANPELVSKLLKKKLT